MTDTTDRKAEVLQSLTAGIARLTSSTEWLNWLETSSRFYRYSFGNQLLIHVQRSDATRVAGFNAWRKLNRCVRKGEKGIAILAPVVSRFKVADDDGNETTVVGAPRAFRLAYVFDVAQTDGDPLAEMPIARLTGDDTGQVFDRLTKVAAGLGYSVRFADFDQPTKNGDCTFATKQIRIRNGLAPAMACKTLAHECAHALLHSDMVGFDRERAELEAESVAYVVTSTLGIDSSAYTFAYVASWAGGGDAAIRAISESGARITKAAKILLGTDAEEDVKQDEAA